MFLLSITFCFAEFDIVKSEYLDSVDNKKIQFHYVPFFFDDQFYFVNHEKNLDSNISSDFFIMKDFKIQIFEGRKIISEIVEKDPTAILQNINDMVKDSKNNIWMLTSDCLLIRYDGKIFDVIKNLREFYQSKDMRGNSLAIDENDNLYIHTDRAELLKYDGNQFIELVQSNFIQNLSPHFLKVQNLIKMKNNIYFYSMSKNISYFDIDKQKYDSLNLNSIFGDTSIEIKSIIFKKEKMYLLLTIQNKLHLYKFDGDNFENIDYVIDYCPFDMRNYKTIIHIDNKEKFYYVVSDKDSNNYKWLFQLDTENKLRRIDFYNNSKSNHLKNLISITGVYTLTDGRIVIPDNSDGGGFYILKEPSSVETPLNVLFVNNIYPNPAKTNVSIDFMVEPENLPNITVELYNLTGILQSKLDYTVDYNDANGQGTLNCNIENIPNGYYIIVIDNGKRKIAKPFIVNKD